MKGFLFLGEIRIEPGQSVSSDVTNYKMTNSLTDDFWGLISCGSDDLSKLSNRGNTFIRMMGLSHSDNSANSKLLINHNFGYFPLNCTDFPPLA